MHHPVLPGPAGGGRQPGRAGAELDGRAGLASLRAGQQPPGPLRHHLLRLHRPPPDRPVRRRRGQLSRCLADRPGHGRLVGRSRRVRRHRHGARHALRPGPARRPARRGDPRRGGSYRHPGRPAGVRHGQRQGRRGAGQRPEGRQRRAAVAGTYIAAMTIGSSSRSAGDSYWVNFAARPGKYLYESTGIRRGMWTVSWYRTVLEGSHGQEPPAGAARLEDLLNAEAGELAPGSNGLLTLPDWLAPGHAAWRRGALLGFDGSQGRAHIYRSILEGIALTMANHTAAMEQALGRRLSPVLVSGGGSSSDLMMQIV